MVCKQCKGAGKTYYPITTGRAPTLSSSVVEIGDITYHRELRECDLCGGTGRASDPERIPVRQEGRRIGTVPPDFDPSRIRSTSWLYTPRDGDFRRVGDAWVAADMLGPGDLEAVPGFRWDRST